MTPDILWFARIGVANKLFTEEHAHAAKAALPPDVTLIDFAQYLINQHYVTDIEALENLLDVSENKATSGPPSTAPFLVNAPARPAPARSPANRRAGPFSFAAIDTLDDQSLADGLCNLLTSTAASGASDLHLSAGARPFIRKNRVIEDLHDAPLSAASALRLNVALLNPEQRSAFLDTKDLDYALADGPSQRYRVNLMFHKGGAAGSYRIVPSKPRSLEELGYERHAPTIEKLLSYHNGLILVTGPVGAGKTTTLACLVDRLNQTRSDHIITVEDPIEVVQPSAAGNVTQREVGRHTRSFASALKGALREDPDIIVIGELRDLETIEMALTAAETGHLVIGTMHTSDAATTLNRLLDAFPAGQQPQVRASVSESLRGVLCQKLLPALDGTLALACEILVNNTAISNLIRDGKIVGLRNTMETGSRDGMCLLDASVFALWEQKRISSAVAQANIANRTLRVRVT
jgi:twitching motility protein PilT